MIRQILFLGVAALVFTACGGGDSSFSESSFQEPTVDMPATTADPVNTDPTPSVNIGTLQDGALSNKYAPFFKVGAAMIGNQIGASDLADEIVLSQFNSITPEFELKADFLSPQEGVYNFENADRLVNWAIANGIEVRGHALVWHDGVPDYMLEGTPQQIRAKLERYVDDVVTHFRGRVQIWDVVNEVVSTDIYDGFNGDGPDRKSRWYDAVGSADYIDWAFRAARNADPDAKLFLNDFQTEHFVKQEWTIDVIRRLRDKGVPIDGVGHQFHLNLSSDPQQLLSTIDRFESEFPDLINHVTELDVNFYQQPGTCWERQEGCLPDIGPVAPSDMLATQAHLLRDLYSGLESRNSVESVTVWGIMDHESWLASSPVVRNNYPLLFDRNGAPKPAAFAIADSNYVIPE